MGARVLVDGNGINTMKWLAERWVREVGEGEEILECEVGMRRDWGWLRYQGTFIFFGTFEWDGKIGATTTLGDRDRRILLLKRRIKTPS